MLLIAFLWIVLWGARRQFRQTTLIVAWIWSVIAMTAWTLTLVADLTLESLSEPAADHAWYACAVLALCPPIAVLGSRRPGIRVWTWFILVPQILVLGWPVGALWLQGSELHGLQLEIPQLTAFCLVTIMGIGNYCGTRHTLAALCYGASLICAVVSQSTIAPIWLGDSSLVRLGCSYLMMLAISLPLLRKAPAAKSPLDQLWFDFFDTFGIVWGRRIQDRFNHQADREGLPARIELDGFRWDYQPASVLTPPTPQGRVTEIAGDQHGCPSANPVEERAEMILRWLLRRFVDPKWINERLHSTRIDAPSDVPTDS